jgi:cyclopropane fatty-acyl-phospholipid synthase-like methyltransferase
VFTHMKPDETRNYLKEIARLLAPRGRCLATFFLFNDGQDDSFFGFGNDTYRWRNGQVPEEVCGYAEKYVEDLLAQSGLRLRYAPFYGGRPGSLSGQDILVMEHASEGYEL